MKQGTLEHAIGRFEAEELAAAEARLDDLVFADQVASGEIVLDQAPDVVVLPAPVVDENGWIDGCPF